MTSFPEGRHPEAPRFHQRGEGSGAKYFILTHYRGLHLRQFFTSERDKMLAVRYHVSIALLIVSLGGWGIAQQQSPLDQGPGPSQAPPRSDQQKDRDREAEAGQSSSRDTRIDVSPPKDDAKNHPHSGVAISEPAAETSGEVQEFHPWNPYRAAKDDEVGDFYLKRKNYRAALARYQDALVWKDNDAVANFRMAQCYEKLDQPDEAITHYQEYLKILPQGPFSKDAQKALERLKAAGAKSQAEKIQPKQ